MANVYIRTFGCALNQSDSEIMAGVLEKNGHEIVFDESKADVVVINSCTVKDDAENKLYRELRRHKDKKVIIAGCVAQAEQTLVNTKLKDYSIIGTSQIHHIGSIINDSLSGERIVLLEKEKTTRINLPRISKNSSIRIIPISEGCLSNCTYCKTKQARGELFSYKKSDIITEIKKAVDAGARQIWITSQDTGAYGFDIGETLPSLLEEVIKIEGDFKVRLGMCNPNFALIYLNKLIKIFQDDKMFKFVHFPLQSGSNKILKSMGRGYTKDNFLKVEKEFRKKIPFLTFATDIIIGFPGETEKDFEESIDVIKEVSPEILNMSRFWKRPGTKAAKMKPTDSKVVKERSVKMRKLFHKISLEKNKEWVGWKGDVIIEEKGKHDSVVARNFAFRPVVIKNHEDKLKDKVRVIIVSAEMWDLRGEVING